MINMQQEQCNFLDPDCASHETLEVNKTWDDITKCWKISVTSDFPFFGGSIDIPMFISNYFLHSENIAGIDGAASPQVVLADICFLATSRKMPKLATSPHSIILYIYVYI